MHELIEFLNKCAKWFIICFAGVIILFLLIYVIAIHQMNKTFTEDETTSYYYYNAYNSTWEDGYNSAEVENESTTL